MTDNLLPCPFCGRPGVLEIDSDHHGEWFNLGCAVGIDALGSTCPGANLFYTDDIENKDEAIKRWNTRTPAMPYQEAAEKVAVAMTNEFYKPLIHMDVTEYHQLAKAALAAIGITEEK